MKFSLAFKKNEALLLKENYKECWQEVQATLLRLIDKLTVGCHDYLHHEPKHYTLEKNTHGEYQLRVENCIYNKPQLHSHQQAISTTYQKLKAFRQALAKFTAAQAA